MAAGSEPGAELQTQPMERRGYRAVDGLVEDMDPNARSLRQIQPGLRQQGGQQGANVYRKRGSDNGRLYYVTPGVVAEYDRSQYIGVENRGQFYIFQDIPPNTVFHIGLPPANEEAAPPPDSPYRVDARIDARSDRSSSADAERATRSGSPDWSSYARHRQAQRAAVIQAIDRLSGDAPPSP